MLSPIRRKRIAAVVLGTAAAFSAFRAPSVFGQAVASAQISGTVADSSGAAIPGAHVTVTQRNTGVVRSTQTGAAGTYTLPNLPVGPYGLTVDARGFKTYMQNGILLQVSNSVTINVTLQVGSITQQVQVSANATMVQTQSTSVSQVIDQRRVVDLPLNGRQATQLIVLSGAAATTPPGNDATSKNYSSATTISVAGGQSNGTGYLLDGGINSDEFNVNLPFPFPDAIQEFSVETNSLSARYGVHPGAVVNVITKSGSNQYHGDLFEFVRNGAFNARNFFAATQDTLRRNQFGGTIGGPIKKGKIFGFFGYQGTRVRSTPPQTISFVPTAAMLSGDFSQFESASCQSNHKARTITDPATGQAYANDFVNPATFNAQALALLKNVPVASNPCGEITYGIPSPDSENQYIGRVDWNQSAKNQFFGRYFISNYIAPPSFGGDLLLTTQAGVNDRSQSVVLGDTYSISPQTVNSAHATWTRLRVDRGPASNLINPASVGVNIYNPASNFINMSVSSDFAFGCGTCAPAFFNNNNVQLADDVDLMHGRHHIAFGGEWIHEQFNMKNVYEANGIFDFSGQFSGDPMLDFLLGLPNNFVQTGLEENNFRQNYIGSYLQDDFRASKRLSVSVGLRWEPFLPETDIYNRGNSFHAPAFAAGQTSTVFVNAPPGLFFVGDPGIPRGFIYNHLSDFEPRLGVVWDPTGNDRQTIRAGFGLFYDTPLSDEDENYANTAPWNPSVSLPSPAGGLTNPYLGFSGGNPFPETFPPSRDFIFPPEGYFVTQTINMAPTSMQQWDLSYERQLTSNWMISATYIGNKTTHVWVPVAINPAVYIPGEGPASDGCSKDSKTGLYPLSCTGNTNQRRLLYLENPVTGSYYADMYTTNAGSNGEYNALLLSAQHRFARNYTILANYTYSHCISEGEATGNLSGTATQLPFTLAGERGNCDYDVRHILNFSLVAESPKLSNPWANRLLGRWQLAPIISYHSGYWFSPLTGVDNSLTGTDNDRPNALANPYVENTNTREWLAASAFEANPIGTFGNAGRDSLVGPGYFDIDTDISRYFRIRESQQVELRFEFFNLGNNVNFNNPTNSLNSSSFGKILGANSPRILEFALKYDF